MSEWFGVLDSEARSRLTHAGPDGNGPMVATSVDEPTAAGQLRHSRFLGLRGDEPPVDVVREEPQ